MADVLMPAIATATERARLVKWLKRVGDVVKAGDVLAEIATERATMEVEAGHDGVLGAILVGAGAGVMASAPIARIFSEAEAAAARLPPSIGAAPHPAVPATFSPQGGEKVAPEIPAGTTFVRMSVREALRDALAEEMRRDPDVFVMGEEIGAFQGTHRVTQGLLHEFSPRRVRDVPVVEHAFTGLCVGAALAGLRPVVEFMSFSFALQAMDQIVNSAAKAHFLSGGGMNAPLVFRGPNGAGPRAGAQRAQDFAAMFAHVPGLKVIAPYSAADAKGLLKSAIRDPGPVIFLESEILYGEVSEVPRIDDWLVPIGKARVARAGRDATIVAWSAGMRHALGAAAQLAKDGIDAEVIDLRTIRPMDGGAIVASVAKTGRCVVVDEGWPRSGVAAEIMALLMERAFGALQAPVARVTGADVPMPYAANLEMLALPDAESVARAVKDALQGVAR